MIAKIKEVFSKEHLVSALMVFAGYALANMAVIHVAPYIADIIPGANYDKVVTVAVVVIVVSMFGQKMITLGAMVVLINVILLTVGIDLVAIVGGAEAPVIGE